MREITLVTSLLHFETLYHQDNPVGSIGRGTHYSVLRVPCWKDVDLSPLDICMFHDFAVIWDEDHDDRVYRIIEQIHHAGLLSPIQFIGERKGEISIILSSSSVLKLGIDRIAAFITNLQPLMCPGDGDVFSFHVTVWPGTDIKADSDTRIISDEKYKTHVYLQHINLLWKLGLKSTLVGFQLEND